MTITDLVARIDQRLADIDSELADLTRARDALVKLQAQPAPAQRQHHRQRTAPPRTAAGP